MKLFFIILLFPVMAYSQLGAINIDTIVGHIVTMTAWSSYDINVIKYELVIYQDGIEYSRGVYPCTKDDRAISIRRPFAVGHNYEVKILNVKTKELLFISPVFKMQ
jgi:hypothetical protein